MNITTTRKIRTPQLHTDGSDASEELNARMYNWVKRTAVPTLDEYVLDPFETALKEDAMKHALEKEGLKEGEWLRERHIKKWEFPCATFEVAAYRSSSIGHEAVLGQGQKFLEDCIRDNAESVHREFVQKSEEGPHVSATYILQEFGRWREAYTKFYNKQEIQIDGELPSEIRELSVALDIKRCRVLNEANAHAYLRAKTLKKSLGLFVRDFTEHVRERHGVDAVVGAHEVDYVLSDDSTVRYLFFPKETSVHYGKMIEALTKEPEKNIVASTGDLVILRDLGFKEDYQKKGSGGILVSTQRMTSPYGICILDRLEKGKVSYSVYDNAHKGVYVQARGLLNRMSDLRKVYSSEETQMKVDFFPGAPEGL